jgi:glycogen debranching enzyme
MAGAGVPSAITSNGLDTWADLKRVGIFVECDWSDLKGTSMQILEVAGKPITLSDLAYVRTQISIQANVGKLIQRVAQV